MKVNINSLAPIDASADNKQGVGATVYDMKNYYEDGGKAIPFDCKYIPFKVSDGANSPLQRWHFSEVDIAKLLSGQYEINKTTGKVTPIGFVLGVEEITNTGGVWSGIPDEYKTAGFLVSADGNPSVTSISQASGMEKSSCSDSGKIIIYAGSDGSITTNYGVSWTKNTISFIDVLVSPGGDMFWGITETALYYSTDGTTWTQKESIALLEIKMVDGILYGRTGEKLYSYATKDAEKKEFSVLSTGFCKGNSHYLNTATHIIDMRTGLIVVESSTCEAVSDEPPMSKVWALKKSGIWRDQDGAIIPVPLGKMEITYLCITKNVMICDNSFLYVNGEYVCVLPETTSLWRVIGNNVVMWKIEETVSWFFSTFWANGFYWTLTITRVSLSTGEKTTSSHTQLVSSLLSYSPLSASSIRLTIESKNPEKGTVLGFESAWAATRCFIWDDGYQIASNEFGAFWGDYYYSISGGKYTRFLFEDGTFTADTSYNVPLKGNVLFADDTRILTWDGTNSWGVDLSEGGSVLCESLPIQWNMSEIICGSNEIISEDEVYENDNCLFRRPALKIFDSEVGISWSRKNNKIIISSSYGVFLVDETSFAVEKIGNSDYPVLWSGGLPAVGLSTGNLYMVGSTGEMGEKIWNISISGNAISVLASTGETLGSGKYYFLTSEQGEPIPLVDPTSMKQMIVFRRDDGVLFKKTVGSTLGYFFTEQVFASVPASFTYLPSVISPFGARFAMGGGKELKEENIITNGTFDASITGWTAVNATWGSSYGQQGGGVLISNGSISQEVSAEAYIFMLCKGDFSGMDGITIITSGEWSLVALKPTKEIVISSAGTLYVDTVKAITFNDVQAMVSISSIAEYEEFFDGTGAQIKIPSRDTEITGLVPVGKSLYVVKKNTTGRIDETGDASNPYYVTEMVVPEGGSFPTALGTMFFVAREKTSDFTKCMELFLFNGTQYERVNYYWNSGAGIDRAFPFGKFHVATVGDIILIHSSEDYCSIVRGVNKVGNASFLGSGCMDGDITDGSYCAIDPENKVFVYAQGGEASSVKRVRSVSVLPPQDVTLEISTENGASVSASAIGNCGVNISGAEVKITINATRKISQIVLDIDKIMPRNRL